MKSKQYGSWISSCKNYLLHKKTSTASAFSLLDPTGGGVRASQIPIYRVALPWWPYFSPKPPETKTLTIWLHTATNCNKLCGRSPQYAPAPCKLTFELLTLKVVSESRVTWPTSVPILDLLGLSVLDLGPMYAADRRQTRIIA